MTGSGGAPPPPAPAFTSLFTAGILDPALLDVEEGELLVAELVEEVVSRGQDVLFEKHISSQVLPYALQVSKEALIKAIQWEFFKEDVVDMSEPCWFSDNGSVCPPMAEVLLTVQARVEPSAIPVDAWARGVLPTQPTSAVSASPASSAMFIHVSSLHPSTTTSAATAEEQQSAAGSPPSSTSPITAQAAARRLPLPPSPADVKPPVNGKARKPDKPRFTTSLHAKPDVNPLPPPAEASSTLGRAPSPRNRTYKPGANSRPLAKTLS
ncbi:hypothetical protein RI367_002515 [Sorochytrium milnesiophthora]